MKKRICICLVLSVVLALCCLLNAAPEAAAATEFCTAAGISYPAVFGEPILGEEAAQLVKEDIGIAAEQITNVGDAIYYIDAVKDLKHPEDYCELFARLLKNDYDEIGIIYLPREDGYNEPYSYIKQDGICYPFDPMTIAWFDDYWLDGMQAYTDLDALAAEIVAVSIQLNLDRHFLGTYMVVPVYASGICNVNGVIYPSAFGEPVLGEEAAKLASRKDTTTAAEQITTVGDAIYYIGALPHFDQPQDACQLFADLLDQDYDEVGMIELSQPDNHYFLIYVVQDGVFFPFDPFRYAEGVSSWVFAPEGESDLDVLAENLMNTCPYHDDGSPMTSYATKPIYSDKICNVKGIQYASALGKPILGEDIAKLARSKDFTAAVEQITNVGDAILFIKALPAFQHPEDPCKLLADLLARDYDEVGYIYLTRQEDGYGYPVVYIGQDNIFYAFDPFNMAYSPQQWPTAMQFDTDLNALCEDLMATFPYNKDHIPAISYSVKIVHSPYLSNVDGIPYASILGEPVLGEAAAELAVMGDTDAAAKQITNVGDAIHYMASLSSFNQPRDACWLFVDLLKGDYDEVGVITLTGSDDYTVTYIQQDGIFHPFDPFQFNDGVSIWHSPLENETDLDVLCGKLMRTCPYHLDGIPLTDYTVSTTKFYTADGTPYLSLLGQPILKEGAAELTDAEAAEKITNVGDAIYYMRSIPKFTRQKDACKLFAQLLADDYDEVGFITLSRPGNAYTLAYVKQGGVYYPLDPSTFADGIAIWDAVPDYESDMKTLCAKLMTSFPYSPDNAPMVSYTVEPVASNKNA